MYRDAENVAYYITCMNENYQHPALPAGSEDGILRGMYRLREGQGDGPRVQLMGAGTILREHLAAAEILERDHAIAADVWSMTSYNELRRDGLDTDRWNRLHPEATPRTCHVERSLTGVEGPFIAATDYIKLLPDSIRQWIPGRYDVLGTDGFGRSDARAQLRKHFEVDAASIVVAALHALAQEGKVEATVVTRAIESLGIDPEKVPPILS